MWNSKSIQNSIKLERIQRTFTRIIFARCNLNYDSYCNRMKLLSLNSIKFELLINDLCMVWKILHKRTPLSSDVIPIKPISSRPSRSPHTMQIVHPNQRSKIIDNFLPFRVREVWNELPAASIQQKRISAFRKYISLHLAHMQYDFDA